MGYISQTFAILVIAQLSLTSALPRHSIHQRISTPPIISTSSGQIHGIIDPANPNVRQYLGIPYAQPPIGDLRWENPIPYYASDTEVQATKLPASCMQYHTTNGQDHIDMFVDEFQLQGLKRTGNVSEDCLTLSVWAPTVQNEGYMEKMPVILFFYGGGFATGGQDVPYQMPTQWIQRTQDHLVVSFNYRLNIFGFPNAEGLEDQNLGLLDQRLAVEWVYQNIEAFGGDSKRITLFGQSAGAMSVDYYSYTYPDNALISGRIMDSGNALSAYSYTDDAYTSFTFVADNVGCSGLKPSSQLSCMKNVSAAKIEEFIEIHQNSKVKPTISFIPVSDEKVVFSNYTDRALKGLQAKVPAIIGNNLNEGEAFAQFISGSLIPNQTDAELITMAQFLCSQTETIRLGIKTKNLPIAYRHIYAGNFSNISPLPWMGAYHSAELPLIFGTASNYRGNGSELEWRTSYAMQDSWVAFARDPYSLRQQVGWEPYSLSSRSAREFGGGVPVKSISLTAEEAKCAQVKEAWEAFKDGVWNQMD